MLVRKRPVTIEVREYDGENRDRIIDWIENDLEPPEGVFTARTRVIPYDGDIEVWNHLDDQWLKIPSGHYVAVGTQGELYPMAPSALAQTYDEVEDVSGIDIGNLAHGVAIGSRGGLDPVQMMVGPVIGVWAAPVDVDSALVIAAWVVALADPAGTRFPGILERVRNT